MGQMSGSSRIMRIIPRTLYTFTALGTSTSQVIIIAQHIDIGTFQEVDLVVRGHSGSVGTGCAINVQAYLDGWTPEDPVNNSLVAATDVAGHPYGQVSYLAGASFPSYGVVSIVTFSGDTLGRLLGIQIQGQQTTGGTAFSVYVSIDLVCKGGDPAGVIGGYNTYCGYK